MDRFRKAGFCVLSVLVFVSFYFGTKLHPPISKAETKPPYTITDFPCKVFRVEMAPNPSHISNPRADVLKELAEKNYELIDLFNPRINPGEYFGEFNENVYLIIVREKPSCSVLPDKPPAMGK